MGMRDEGLRARVKHRPKPSGDQSPKAYRPPAHRPMGKRLEQRMETSRSRAPEGYHRHYALQQKLGPIGLYQELF